MVLFVIVLQLRIGVLCRFKVDLHFDNCFVSIKSPYFRALFPTPECSGMEMVQSGRAIGSCSCNMGKPHHQRCFGKPFRNSPYRFRGRLAIRGEDCGARVSALPVVDGISRYPNVRARPEPLLRPAAHALGAVVAVAPVVAADVGPL